MSKSCHMFTVICKYQNTTDHFKTFLGRGCFLFTLHKLNSDCLNSHVVFHSQLVMMWTIWNSSIKYVEVTGSSFMTQRIISVYCTSDLIFVGLASIAISKKALSTAHEANWHLSSYQYTLRTWSALVLELLNLHFSCQAPTD